jgi:hypothetical protein
LNEYDDMLRTGAVPAAQGNPYDAIVREQQDADTAKLRGSMQVAASTSPDQAAKVIQLSERLKLPRQIVERNFDTLSKKYDLSDNEYETIVRENPTLTRWLADPANASVARDDVGVLRRVETTLSSFGRGISRAGQQGELADLLYKEVETGTLSPQAIARRDALKAEMKKLAQQDSRNGVPEYLASVTGYSARQLISSMGATLTGAGAGGIAGATVGSVLPGVGTVAGGTAGMIAGGLTASANYSYRLETAFAFDELREMKDVNGNAIDPQLARRVARGVGVVNTLIETGSDVAIATLIPGFNKLVAGLGGDQAKRAVMQQVKAALAVPTRRTMILNAVGKMGAIGSVEGIEEFVQGLVGAVGRESAQAASGQRFAPDSAVEDVARASREAMDAAIGTFFTFAPVGGAHYYVQQRQAAQAQKNQAFFEALGGVSSSRRPRTARSRRSTCRSNRGSRIGRARTSIRARSPRKCSARARVTSRRSRAGPTSRSRWRATPRAWRRPSTTPISPARFGSHRIR